MLCPTINRIQFDRNWTYQQVAVAEYLDTFSELSARGETLHDFLLFYVKKLESKVVLSYYPVNKKRILGIHHPVEQEQ